MNTDEARMLRLGHIEYSNCFPVHAALLDRGAPDGVELRTGIPTALNEALARGAIDVAPSSSIEYARHADRYRVLRGLAIGSRGEVRSILLETTRPLPALDGAEVALPTASATSVVLLRVLLERAHELRPRYRWFEQVDGADPIAEGAAAALWIGDVALRRRTAAGRALLDLGAEWTDWTGLPFVYAIWQVAAGPERDDELESLHGVLRASRAYFEGNAAALACRHAERYRMRPSDLLDYWMSLDYGLDDSMRAGLLRFYDLAAGLDEVPAVPELRWVPAPTG